MSLPDTDTLLRLALLAVVVYLLVAVGPELLLVTLAVGVIAVPLLGAVLLFRWLAAVLGTPGAVLTVAAGLGLGILAYAVRRWRR